MNKVENIWLNKMNNILGEDFNLFKQSLERPSEKSLLVNENKISVENFQEIIDFPIEKIAYEKAGFYLNQEKYGRHAMHHAGAFYLQEPSAMFTVNAHQFKGDEIVLDMCAAPGGKTIQIANRIPNGVLVSNEFVASRSQILFSNVERMGLKNVIITNEKPQNLANAYGGCFDVCLVDAPCSGEGMFRKGEDVISFWNENLPQMCAKRQKEILLSADECLKQKGILIYSTCTYSTEENEEIVSWLVDELNYKLINIDVDYGFPRGIDMPQVVRLYPHKVRGEGQFIAVLQKNNENLQKNVQNLSLKRDKIAEKFFKDTTGIEQELYEFNKYSYCIPNLNLIKRNINYVSLGVKIGENLKTRFEPFHNFFTAFKNEIKIKLDFDYNSPKIQKYLKGETLDVDLPNGYGVISASNCSVGGFKISQGKFKNLYPKGLRNFK